MGAGHPSLSPAREEAGEAATDDGRQVSARLRPQEKSWQSWRGKRLGPSGSARAPGLWGGEILIWEPGDPKTWEWISQEDPAQGSQWIPRYSAEDLGVDPRRGSGASGLGSHSVPSRGDGGR